MRVRLDLAYDGTDFAGWARQRPDLRTVQQTLEEALATVLRLGDVPAVTVAGRTDAGVHARGQVCHVDVPLPAWQASPARSARSAGEALVRRLAGVLPPDIVVARATEAPAGFDARFSATSRHYAYRLVDGPHRPDPLTRRHVAWHPRPVDLPLLAAASELLLGEHDFAAYCRRREGATTLRRLLRLDWAREPAAGCLDEIVVARVDADAFCHAMVRSLVGALLAVGEGRRPVTWPADVLARRVRDSAVQVAPARGLTLERVTYPPDDELAARVVETRRLRTF